MTKKLLILCLVALVVIIASFSAFYKNITHCRLTDAEAITIARAFYTQFSHGREGVPTAQGHDYPIRYEIGRWTGCSPNGKSVKFKENDRIIWGATMDCETKELIGFGNYQITSNYHKQYEEWVREIPDYPESVHKKWPPYLSEEKARKIFDELAIKLRVPADYKLQKIIDDKQEGLLRAEWVKQKNGFDYEMSGISISIVGFTGEFVGYGKNECVSDCKTDVKVSEEQAEKKARKALRGIIGNKAWKEIGDWYKVQSAELKIVQPKVFFGLYTSRESRLAWVFKYKLARWFYNIDEFKDARGRIRLDQTGEKREKYDALMKKSREKSKELGEPPYEAIIKIDAENGKAIGVSTTKSDDVGVIDVLFQLLDFGILVPFVLSLVVVLVLAMIILGISRLRRRLKKIP